MKNKYLASWKLGCFHVYSTCRFPCQQLSTIVNKIDDFEVIFVVEFSLKA